MSRFIAIILVSLSAPLIAGDLFPPGPPEPTMRTLQEIEPRQPIHPEQVPVTIGRPGHYYLTGDVRYNGTSDGIVIDSSNVTLDLQGFTLRCTNPGGGDGIKSGYPHNSITVRNGTIAGWSTGLDVFTTSVLVEKVRVAENAAGIFVGSGEVIDCVAERNADNGISFFDYIYPSEVNNVRNCRSTVNDGNGIVVRNNCSVSECTASYNGEAGILVTGNSASIKNNIVSNNDQHGFSINNSFAVVSENLSSHNAGYGFNMPNGYGRLENNTATGNTSRGFYLGSGYFAAKNVARQTGTAFVVNAGTVLGPVVNMTSGGTVTSDHPWANFVY